MRATNRVSLSWTCLLPALLIAVLPARGSEPDISGPWKTAGGDLMLIDLMSSGDWRLRRVSDGSRHTLTADGQSTYVVTHTNGDHAGRMHIPDGGPLLTWHRAGATAPLHGAPLRGALLHSVRIPITHHDFLATADDGVTLRGRLSVAAGQAPEHLVLLVHGSERSSAIRHFWYRDLFMANGFAVIVFDKRGTGESGGQFTMDFDRLAADVRAAATAAVELLDSPPTSLGLAGFSQGGWIAPLAAIDLPMVDYVLVSYGLIDSPHDEARALGLVELRQAGLEPDALAEAEHLLVAALDVVACDYRCGWPAYHALAERYGDHGWLRHITDDRVQSLLAEPEWRLRIHGQRMLMPLSWHYHSAPLLAHHDIPMAWMIAEDDSVAPPGYTIRFLSQMIEQGKPYVLHTYPGTDHGILRFTETGGRRQYHGHDPRYLHDLVEEARRLSGMDIPCPPARALCASRP